MPITFLCPVCNAATEVDDDLAGRRIKCRECDALGRVPFSLDYKRPRNEEAPVPAVAEQRAASVPPVPLSRKTLVLGTLLGSTLTATIATIIFLLLHSPSPPPEPPKQQAASQPTPEQPFKPRPVAPMPVQHPVQPPNPQLVQQPPADLSRQLAEQERLRQQFAELARINAAIEAEKERQRQVQIELGLLSSAELQLALNVARKLNTKPVGLVGERELAFMRDHWIIFDTPTVHQAMRQIPLVQRFGFEEICTNLNVAADKRTAYAVDLLLHFVARPPGRGYLGLRTVLAVSREYKKGGLAGLPTAYKRFVQENPDVFASILK